MGKGESAMARSCKRSSPFVAAKGLSRSAMLQDTKGRRKKSGRDKPPSSSSLSCSKNPREVSPTHATTKQTEGSRIVAKKPHKSRLEKRKVKKILKKMALEVAEKRGELSYMKDQLHTMEAAAKEIESKFARIRAKNQIQFLNDIWIQRSVDVMLGFL